MPSGPITTGNHPKALWPGVNAWWGVGYGEHPEECRDLYDFENSGQNYEEDVQMNPFPLAPVKPESGSVTYAGQVQGYVSRYVHVAYALGWIITYEELKDNKYPKLSKSRSKANGFSMRQTKENVGANVYNRMTAAAYVGGDGATLISTTHPTAFGNQSNRLTVNADFSEEACEDLLIQIDLARDEQGNRIALQPRSLHIPPQLWWECNRVLKSVLQNDTANNALNVLKSTNALPGGIIKNHYFSDPDAWHIRTNCMDGMKAFQRDKIPMRNDSEFDTMNAKAFSYDRYSFGWTDWRGLFASEGA